jgi:hypothetical protein
MKSFIIKAAMTCGVVAGFFWLLARFAPSARDMILSGKLPGE